MFTISQDTLYLLPGAKPRFGMIEFNQSLTVLTVIFHDIKGVSTTYIVSQLSHVQGKST